MKWQMDIGDWSSDGHGRFKTITLNSKGATAASIRKAWRKGNTLFAKHIRPTVLCEGFEENSVTRAVADDIEKAYNITLLHEECCGEIEITVEDMANIIAAVVTAGGVKTTVADDDIPRIQLDTVGYGLFYM